MNNQALADLAITAAKRAADHIQSQAGKQREVLTKDGGGSRASQVVTEVDFECQRLILEILDPSIEAHNFGLLTEELKDDSSRHTCDYFWCVDPLDGTLPFIENVAGYSVSIALLRRDGTPVIGVVHDPVTSTTYHAVRDGGVFCNRAPWSINSKNPHLTLVTDRSFAKQPDYGRIMTALETLAPGLRIINQGGAAMNAIWVIENAPAVYFKFPKSEDGGGSIWDFAASACIFNELGTPVTNIHGHPLNLNRRDSTFMNKDGVVYASSEKLALFVRGLL